MEKNYIIGIGLSAGGLEPLKEIIANLNPNLSHSYIILEHHSRTTENRLINILPSLTKLKVKEATDNEKIEPQTIYICPSNSHLIVVDNKIELYNIESETEFKPSINWFFESLSKQTAKAVAVILSGALNDGSNEILNIKLRGGLIIAQDPNTAEFPMMPQSAINTKLVDFILTSKEIAETINNINEIDKKIHFKKLGQILKFLKSEFNVNFNEYKEGTIIRRIERRMILNKIPTLEGYLKFIKSNPKEKKLLFDDLLIIVTSFCRDKEMFLALKEVLTEYIKKVDELKVWDIGCATGEESYSLAILIKTILEENNIQKDFHIFATDLSIRAINIAREGVYPTNEVEMSFPNCPIKFFEKKGDDFIISKEIRKHISFANHNILQDTPLTNIDLIVCRNLLIYFKLESQEKFFRTANYALKNNGLLFIGKSENLPEKTEKLFTPLDLKHKIYKNNNSQKLFPINYHFSLPKQKFPISKSILEVLKENLNATLNTFVIIDSYGNILYTAGDFEKYLKLPKGEFNSNIFSFIDEELNLPIHSIISNKTSSINYKIRLNNNKIQYINLISIPLTNLKDNTIALFFLPSSNEISLSDNKKHCEEIEHELIDTKQKLKHTLEELSTTNEELQTSNEELQSSNEELITTNEELKAVNESLNKANAELNKYKNHLEQKVKQKANEIIKQKQIRSAIFENTKDLIVIIEDNKIIDVNRAFLNFFEIANFYEFNYIFYYEKEPLSILQLLKLPNDTKIKIKNKIFLIKISKLDYDRFAINFIDVTIEENYIKELKKEIKKQVKIIRKKDVLLQNQYKLARMGEMLESIGHQYRQPLNKLSLILAKMEMNIDTLTKEEILNSITKSNEIIQFLSNTIDDFKNMFQTDSNKTIFNLYQFIKKTLKFIEIDKIIKNIDIKIDIDKNFTIATYGNELNHILINILHNAKDAIIETNPENPYIKISTKRKNNDIIIKIKNNGHTIENVKKIFKPYVTTKKNGNGMGLYISKIIAKDKLHGKLWAKNKKNGVTFYLRIPNEGNL